MEDLDGGSHTPLINHDHDYLVESQTEHIKNKKLVWSTCNYLTKVWTHNTYKTNELSFKKNYIHVKIKIFGKVVFSEKFLSDLHSKQLIEMFTKNKPPFSEYSFFELLKFHIGIKKKMKFCLGMVIKKLE